MPSRTKQQGYFESGIIANTTSWIRASPRVSPDYCYVAIARSHVMNVLVSSDDCLSGP